MNENTFVDNVFFCVDIFLSFCRFKMIRCIVKSLITIQRIFVEAHLKIEKLKKNSWVPEFGCSNRYTGLQNSLDTSHHGHANNA